jgi:hypothetical protein
VNGALIGAGCCAGSRLFQRLLLTLLLATTGPVVFHVKH